MDDEIIANRIGDGILNRCYKDLKFFKVLEKTYDSFFFWTEPYPLFVIILVVLVILPGIFKFCSQGVFLKIYRLYNIVRLGLLSIFHQVAYSYTLIQPTCPFFFQSDPCTTKSKVTLSSLSFPSSLVSSCCFFIFSVARFSNVTRWKEIIFYIIFFTIYTLTMISEGHCSLFQITVSIFMSYIIHFIHLYIHFKWIHIENCILFIYIISSGLYCSLCLNENLKSIFYVSIFPVGAVLIDEFLLIRHQITRGGFNFERPADISWSIETEHTGSIKLLNNENEENLEKNLSKDFLTSVLAFAFLFIIILVRGFTVKNFFTLEL